MPFEEEEDSIIQWGACAQNGLLSYPPTRLKLRGTEYFFLQMACQCVGGANDGETWYYVKRVIDTDNIGNVWVSESIPGEFVQVFVPVKDKGKYARA